MAAPPIDKDQLRAFVHRQDREALLELLDRAIDLLAASKLPQLIAGYADPGELRQDGASPSAVREAAERFHARSLAGEYYESFSVNSKNWMDQSRGTATWIGECRRILDACVAAASGGAGHAAIGGAMELIFDLLRRLDDGEDDIVFFADEAGSWQIGVDFGVVLPAWFTCLARTAEPARYAAAVRAAIGDFAVGNEPRLLLAAAVRAASPAQRVALAATRDGDG